MMEFKGTKGKWTYHITGDSQRVYHNIQSGEFGGKTIALLYEKNVSQEQLEANGQLIATAPELLQTLISIYNMSEDIGREGCTYGDTDFDSLSAAYGYNTALNHIKSNIESVIKKATE